MVKKKLIDIFSWLKLKDSRKGKHVVGCLFLLFLFVFNSLGSHHENLSHKSQSAQTFLIVSWEHEEKSGWKTISLSIDVVYKAFLFLFFCWLFTGNHLAWRSIEFKSIILFVQGTEIYLSFRCFVSLVKSWQEIPIFLTTEHSFYHVPPLYTFAIHFFTTKLNSLSQNECSSFPFFFQIKNEAAIVKGWLDACIIA
jgi:hypothetical protein